MADRTITEARADLAADALYEITLISRRLRDMLAELGGADVELVARGMLARVQTLSETASAAITPDADNRTDADLQEVVRCRPMGVRHG